MNHSLAGGSDRLTLGIDVGTSGVRAAAVDGAGRVAAAARQTMPAPLRDGAAVTQDPELWWQATEAVLQALHPVAHRVAAVAVDGTSLTVNGAHGRRFDVVLVPYTRRETLLDAQPVGAPTQANASGKPVCGLPPVNALKRFIIATCQ